MSIEVRTESKVVYTTTFLDHNLEEAQASISGPDKDGDWKLEVGSGFRTRSIFINKQQVPVIRALLDAAFGKED